MKFTFGIIVFILCTLSFGQLFPTAPAKLLSKAPLIDGNFSQAEWGEAFATGKLLDRITTQVPKDETECWIGYTKKAIYVAFVCTDSEPDKLIGREIIPNSEFRGEDHVLFSINAFGNRTFDNLSRFLVNLLGTQTENIAGGRAGKREWRGDWKARTSKTQTGWVCEMEIPWSILNYPDIEKLNMDINVVRIQGRTLFEQSWANVRQNPLPELQGVWEGVQPPKPPKPKVQFLGYSAPEVEKGVLKVRNGLDARYAFTPSFTGIASVSPDFRNIEDVIAGIDFVRTERFLGETRPFFTEGNDFFNLSSGFSYGGMFYSRRIGAFDAGTKFYGQYTPTIGVGALLTSGPNNEQNTVVNISKAFNAAENLNLFTTLSTKNNRNTATGFEYSRRRGLFGFSLGGSVEQSQNEDSDSAGSASIFYEGKNEFATARYTWVDPGFNPALAFIPWTNRRGGYVFANKFYQYRSGSFREFDAFLDVNEYRTYSGELQQGGWSTGANWATKKDVAFGFNRSRNTFFGSLDDTFGGYVVFNVSNRFKQFGFNYQDGIQNDRSSRFYGLNASYRVVNNLDVTVNQSVLELDGTDRQTISTIAYQLSPVDLVSSRIAVSDAGTNAYLSYRRTGSAGVDLFLILGDPNAVKTTNRISLKAVWAF